MPYDDVLKDDPRPLFLGEYFFPVCHEQTDVSINPGLRELWGHGSAEPEFPFARACAPDFDKPPIKPGLKPGGWSYIIIRTASSAAPSGHRTTTLSTSRQPTTPATPGITASGG